MPWVFLKNPQIKSLPAIWYLSITPEYDSTVIDLDTSESLYEVSSISSYEPHPWTASFIWLHGLQNHLWWFLWFPGAILAGNETATVKVDHHDLVFMASYWQKDKPLLKHLDLNLQCTVWCTFFICLSSCD